MADVLDLNAEEFVEEDDGNVIVFFFNSFSKNFEINKVLWQTKDFCRFINYAYNY